ncbi:MULTISPECIES: helix-turn-helix transcriptional regulator [Enterococcus]|uniref:helix-turn-helix domain-containing protein n=1 Tax=Enterococcus TaxID=1350 RepID=UPI0022E87D4C|nr:MULTISPECIES: helix-turn-helix transcriptional regulator [Enterococcus]
MEKQVASIFRQEVDKQALNQRVMADHLNFSAQNLSHMLNGRRTMGLERVVEIADYLQNPETDFEVAAAMFYTPKPLNRKRRDDHPLSKMVGQDKEEMERIEIEKKFDIWDLLSIPNADLTSIERNEIKDWLLELVDEISSEIAVFTSACDRYGFNSREVVKMGESRERND